MLFTKSLHEGPRLFGTPAARLLFVILFQCEISVASASAALQLDDVEVLIANEGDKSAVLTLYKQSDKWDFVLQKIASGDIQWVKLGSRLHSHADGGAKEMLSYSLGEALNREPKFLLTSASKGQLAINDFCVGPDIDDNRYSTFEAAWKALRSRIVSVRSITTFELRPYRALCLSSLEHSEEKLAEFFGKTVPEKSDGK